MFLLHFFKESFFYHKNLEISSSDDSGRLKNIEDSSRINSISLAGQMIDLRIIPPVAGDIDIYNSLANIEENC